MTLPSLQVLESKVRERIRTREKIAILATLKRGGDDEFEDIIITGKHAGNGNLLYHLPKRAKTEQIRFRSDILRRLTAAERKEIKGLVKAQEAAERAIERWHSTRALNIDAAFITARRAVDGGESKA